MGLLADDQLRAVHTVALSTGLERTALLAGLSAAFRQSIPSAASPSEQILVDLHFLNDAARLADESVPLVVWLETAAHLAAPRSEASIFQGALRDARAALDQVKVGRPPTPKYRDDAMRALGVELERERARKKALHAAGASTETVAQRILEIRRKLREGGQLREGDTLRQYTLLEAIGRGGFAIVWKAFDPERQAVVALKVLHPNLAGDQVRRERFFRGARVMAGLPHPAIVKVLSIAEEDEGFHFFVMEYVDGEDLQHAVLKGRVSRARAAPIILAVGEALALAHAKGFVHRDVKPPNILLTSGGEPKLTDFDLVGAGDTTGGTRTGALGSFLYAAPEILSHPQDADSRADVFGLAMTTVFILYGAPLPQAVLRHTDTFVDALKCSTPMKQVLKRALDWEPFHRFTDAGAFCKALLEDPVERVRLVAQQAESLRRVREYDEALAVLEAGMQLVPHARELREKVCDLLIEVGDTPRAIVKMLAFARWLVEANDVEGAMRVLDEVLLLKPGHAQAVALLDQLLYPMLGGGEAPAEDDPDENTPLPSFELEDVAAPRYAVRPRAVAKPDDSSSPAPPRLAIGEGAVQWFDELALEEVDFFASQGMFEDARALLDEQFARLPNHPLLLDRRRELEVMAGVPKEHGALAASHTVASALHVEDRSFDITASLDALNQMESGERAAHEVSVESVRERFKAGIGAQASESDPATHYDLAVAFKEMGLLTDAISELEVASHDPGREWRCLWMIGNLQLQNGNREAGIDALVRSLHATQKTREQELAAIYEIGDAYEHGNNRGHALDYFQRLARAAPRYVDPRGAVAERVHRLEGPKTPTARVLEHDLLPDEFDAAFDELLGRRRT